MKTHDREHRVMASVMVPGQREKPIVADIKHTCFPFLPRAAILLSTRFDEGDNQKLLIRSEQSGAWCCWASILIRPDYLIPAT